MLGIMAMAWAAGAARADNQDRIQPHSESPDRLVYRYGVDPATGKSALIAVNIARWDASDNEGTTLKNVRFTLPEGVRPSEIMVDGEDRSLAVTDGAFTDEFAPFAARIYGW